jgi:predicted DCC family thiol-disulfide oxidoreductase YuxK
MSWLIGLVERRARPEAAGVARAAVGVAAILKALERAPILERLGSADVVRVPYVAGQPSVADLPAALVLAAWIGLAAAFAAGFAVRITGSLLTLLLVAVLFGDQQLYSNHLYLLTWLVGLLTLADAGAAFSVDALRGHGRRTIAAWPLWLLRVQLTVVYLFAGISKIGATYLAGSVVALSLRSEGPLAIPIEWRVFEVMAVLSILSILAEIGLAIGLWLPRWRRAAFVLGLLLHLGIALWFDPTVPLLVFAVIALSPYVLFLDLEPRPLTVVFDDSCGFCTTWVRWFRRLDWLRALELVPGSDASQLARLEIPREDADRALQLIRGGHRSQGFDAVIGVLERLPVSFLWAPLLRLWPIAVIGRRVYGRVAARRQCSINPAGRSPTA